MISFSALAKILEGTQVQLAADRLVRDLVIDSRKVLLSDQSLFFALSGTRHDGHEFIPELYRKGIRQFVIERPLDVTPFPQANFILVKSGIGALQSLVAHHRKQFNFPVIGITGSNGKTIVKEWLYQLLSPDYQIVKNPGSYNSQIGVPLAVWQMQSVHQLGIFEAGISRVGEMENLQRIMNPTLGIFTNLGTAHDEGFTSPQVKAREKLRLFHGVSKLVYCSDDQTIEKEVNQLNIPAVTWAVERNAHYQVKLQQHQISILHGTKVIPFKLPFTDRASVENVIHCIVLMLELKYEPHLVEERIGLLRSVPMRLEIKQGINGCQVIDDSYNNDLAGLQISLDFMGSLKRKRKSVILSDLLQTGLEPSELIQRIRQLLNQHAIHKLVAIGPAFYQNREGLKLNVEVEVFPNVETAFEKLNWDQFQNEVILVKGARPFHFEKIVARLIRKIHGTRMEIDLNKMVHNLNFFKSKLDPGVKLMVMVKAFAYGSGSEEVANLLQYHRVDYLGVAYADEGVELRKNQISVPIMVMNPSEEGFIALVDNNLEPVVYSVPVLKSLINFLQGRPIWIHLEIETGMHRLGLEESELPGVLELVKKNPNLTVASVFSHLAGADEQKHDDYSSVQLDRYLQAYQVIQELLGYRPLRHLLNSPGLLRMPQHQLDMVRLGIGLYGINPTSDQVDQLQPVATLKTVISQIKTVKAGESVGYGRWGKASHDMKLATLAIGYADGFSRSFSRGVGSVLVNGKKAPVVGNVCMDMTMVDITGIDAREGDDAIIFGEQLSIQEVAAAIETIPYEILTNTSERVKRIFFAESI